MTKITASQISREEGPPISLNFKGKQKALEKDFGSQRDQVGRAVAPTVEKGEGVKCFQEGGGELGALNKHLPKDV